MHTHREKKKNQQTTRIPISIRLLSICIERLYGVNNKTTKQRGIYFYVQKLLCVGMLLAAASVIFFYRPLPSIFNTLMRVQRECHNENGINTS